LQIYYLCYMRADVGYLRPQLKPAPNNGSLKAVQDLLRRVISRKPGNVSRFEYGNAEIIGK